MLGASKKTALELPSHHHHSKVQKCLGAQKWQSQIVATIIESSSDCPLPTLSKVSHKGLNGTHVWVIVPG